MSTLNKEEWMQIAQRGVDNLNGERRKNAALLREAVQKQPSGPIDVEKMIVAINQTAAHSDTKTDAIKMATNLHKKVVARQQMKDILEEEEVLAKKRAQEESQFVEMTVEERADWLKLSDDPALNLELPKLGKQISATPGRKRPRNPEKWLKLKHWEMERGGEKIGDIGPMPPQLREHLKQIIDEREADKSGFTNINDINGDEL